MNIYEKILPKRIGFKIVGIKNNVAYYIKEVQNND